MFFLCMCALISFCVYFISFYYFFPVLFYNVLICDYLCHLNGFAFMTIIITVENNSYIQKRLNVYFIRILVQRTTRCLRVVVCFFPLSPLFLSLKNDTQQFGTCAINLLKLLAIIIIFTSGHYNTTPISLHTFFSYSFTIIYLNFVPHIFFFKFVQNAGLFTFCLLISVDRII